MLFRHAWEESFHIQRKVQSTDDVLKNSIKAQTRIFVRTIKLNIVSSHLSMIVSIRVIINRV